MFEVCWKTVSTLEFLLYGEATVWNNISVDVLLKLQEKIVPKPPSSWKWIFECVKLLKKKKDDDDDDDSTLFFTSKLYIIDLKKKLVRKLWSCPLWLLHKCHSWLHVTFVMFVFAGEKLSVWWERFWSACGSFLLPFQEVGVIERNHGRMHAVVKLHCDHRCDSLDLIRGLSDVPLLFCNCAIWFYQIDKVCFQQF